MFTKYYNRNPKSKDINISTLELSPYRRETNSFILRRLIMIELIYTKLKGD